MKTYKYNTSVTIGRDLDGKPIKKYIRADTKHELEEKKAEILLNKGLFFDSKMTFAELYKTWYQLRIANKTHSYAYSTNNIFQHTILPYLRANEASRYQES